MLLGFSLSSFVLRFSFLSCSPRSVSRVTKKLFLRSRLPIIHRYPPATTAGKIRACSDLHSVSPRNNQNVVRLYNTALVRNVKGLLALNRNDPIANPESWMFGD